MRDAQMRQTLGRFDRPAAEGARLSRRLARLESLGDPNDWRSVEAHEIGCTLHPAHDDEPSAAGHARAAAGGGDALSGSAADRDQRAGLARPLRRRTGRSASSTRKASTCTRRDPRSTGACRRDGEARTRAREVILGGRRLQHAAVADAVGYRPADGARATSASRRACRCLVSGRTFRIATRCRSSIEMIKPWDMLEGATFSKGDPQYTTGQREARASTRPTACCLSVVAAIGPWQPVPDLFCYAVLADFRGYEPGYSRVIRQTPRLR